MLELTVRLVFSLAVVIGLLLLLTKIGSRRFRGQHGALVRVLHRQSLSRNSSVVVVSVGSRLLVLGTTEQQVRVLTELDADELDDPEALVVSGSPILTGLPSTLEASSSGTRRGRGAHRAEVVPVVAEAPTGALAGSVLSVNTWRQALAAATRRAS